MSEKKYYDLTREEKDSAMRFLLEALLRSRITGHFPSNSLEFDEDVNVYLAHLLLANATADFLALEKKYVVPHESEVLKIIGEIGDCHTRYFIFKVNADHRLVHLSVFGDLIKPHFGRSIIYEKNEGYIQESARGYYDQAAHYNFRIYRKSTAVGEVLKKLSRNFEHYCELLKLIRRDFFHLAGEIQHDEFSQFQEGLKAYEQAMAGEEKINSLLDAYLEWKKNPTDELKKQIEELSSEIRKWNPDFKFPNL